MSAATSPGGTAARRRLPRVVHEVDPGSLRGRGPSASQHLPGGGAAQRRQLRVERERVQRQAGAGATAGVDRMDGGDPARPAAQPREAAADVAGCGGIVAVQRGQQGRPSRRRSRAAAAGSAASTFRRRAARTCTPVASTSASSLSMSSTRSATKSTSKARARPGRRVCSRRSDPEARCSPGLAGRSGRRAARPRSVRGRAWRGRAGALEGGPCAVKARRSLRRPWVLVLAGLDDPAVRDDEHPVGAADQAGSWEITIVVVPRIRSRSASTTISDDSRPGRWWARPGSGSGVRG